MENKCKDCCYYNVITDTLGYCDNFKTLSLQVKAEQTNMKCFAWFVWEKGFKGEPTIRWIE